jgi:FHA domain-containing protein
MEAPVRFVIQRISGRGVTLNQVRGNVLRIGRGTNVQLRSDSPAVALEHAAIEATDQGYVISDSGSITGTYVNGRAIERATLEKGSTIEIGDLHIEVKTADPDKPLFLAVSAVAARAAAAVPEAPAEAVAREPVVPQAGGPLRVRRVDFAGAYRLHRPYFTRISAIALVIIITLIFVAKVTTPQNRRAFMPGGLSSAHARARDANGVTVADRCDACHDPWHGVSAAKCSACHHPAAHTKIQAAAPACADCHPEHGGATRLAAMPDTRCVECHSNLRAHVTSGARFHVAANITAFGVDHPDFRAPADRDTLRFNHALHLNPIADGEGRQVRLTCTDCHRMVSMQGGLQPAPIRFPDDCQRCHRLTFDARIPEAEVPHGVDIEAVYGAIVSAYSENRGVLAKPAAERRRLLNEASATPASTRALVAAEHVVKTKCALCHDVVQRANRLSVVPPVIPVRWFEHARFNHLPHRNIDCQSCHSRARESVNTSDVLLPSPDKCAPCHAATPAGSRTASVCVTCHEYHERSKTF